MLEVDPVDPSEQHFKVRSTGVYILSICSEHCFL